MPYNREFADRLEYLIAREFSATGLLRHTKMFGGFGYMLDGKMCMHIFGETFTLRVGEANEAELLCHDDVETMVNGKRPMKGWISIDTACDIEDDRLHDYCTRAVNFVMTLPIKKKK